MGRVLMVVFIMLIGVLNAQKLVQKSLVNPETSYINIDADNCFRIELSTTLSKEIVVEALIDGEYKNDLLVKIEENGPALAISVGFHPSFIKPNDKLSAHKVISISLKVQIPMNMKVRLFGTNTNVYANGTYEDLQVTLDDGTCNFNTIYGTAYARTQSGDIYLYSIGAIVETKNNFGNTSENKIPLGTNYFNLTTTTGNIHLRKTE